MTGISATPPASKWEYRAVGGPRRGKAHTSSTTVAFDLKKAETDIETLADLSAKAAQARHSPPFGSTMLQPRAISGTNGFLRPLPRLLSADIRADDPAAKNDLALFGAHSSHYSDLCDVRQMPYQLRTRARASPNRWNLCVTCTMPTSGLCRPLAQNCLWLR
jgi:hypothetical protein